jgi:hypothetical protein
MKFKLVMIVLVISLLVLGTNFVFASEQASQSFNEIQGCMEMMQNVQIEKQRNNNIEKMSDESLKEFLRYRTK